MDYPTDEDLYELQYQDELDALNDMESADPYEDGDFDPFSFGSQKTLSTKNKPDKNQSTISNASNSKENGSTNIPTNENSATDKLPTKRKLLDLYVEDPVEEDSYDELMIDEFSESLISQKDRKKSCLWDDEPEIVQSAKKRRTDQTVPTDESRFEEQSRAGPSTSFTYSIPTYADTLTLTRSDGRRINFGVKDEEDSSDNILDISHRAGSLLPVSIEKLKLQYFIMEEKLFKERDAQFMEGLSTSTEVPEVEEDKENNLWVEKYRPMTYTHLLSEEGINRTMLQWLKLWDKIVFGKEKKIKKKVAKKEDHKKENKFKKTWGELVEDLDEHGRPYHKVAFLCGPPGLGKTTLATIIAKHAGYNVVELNASDDRNPEAFRTSLEAATQMKSVLMGQNPDEKPKPNCLILDEIDGAPAASINVLLQFIKSVGIPKGVKRKKGDIPLLTRPLICICNDQYSPALKPLRQLALVLNFPSTAAARLASRLHEVATKEGLVADMAVLTKLCEKTSNDIRSCLSTLQFIHRQKTELKAKDLEGMHIGQKDMQKSLFAVWQDIFHFKHQKSFSNVFGTVQAFGDYEKVYVGMFENYLNIKFKQKTLEAIYKGAEWSCFGDIVQQQIAHKQLYFLMPYLPYPAVAFHMLFAANTYSQHKARRSQLSSTLTSVIKDMISSLKTFLNPSLLLLDVFPFLTEIIKPNLRPVNTQLYSAREKGELRRVIELMLAFKLNYHQERSLDGTYNYILDPNIEELIRFSDIKPKKILTYSAKQMIAREVEVEQMRKGDTSADTKAAKLSATEAPKRVLEPKVFQKKKEVADRPVLDFFGRQIVQSASAKLEEEKKSKEKSEEVWFHFKEGYSNAVRRTVYIKNLL
ncbi:hypothetical protein JTE90_009531 [Oedothorax gibbosus]|uniref:AAA+ ATPase domain-containing protein n=1 Tax=Oedothorax gibbosus TaxID=931172 RepID=A0AAV6USZ2_9ARAC|nr:hypothetical protein JTE90_009531 [Oedothorax gibbosus]